MIPNYFIVCQFPLVHVKFASCCNANYKNYLSHSCHNIVLLSSCDTHAHPHSILTRTENTLTSTCDYSYTMSCMLRNLCHLFITSIFLREVHHILSLPTLLMRTGTCMNPMMPTFYSGWSFFLYYKPNHVDISNQYFMFFLLRTYISNTCMLTHILFSPF